mgnify:CR=1 FL=1
MNYFEPGQEIETTIVQISNDTIFLDLNQKTEGILDKAELQDANGNINVKEGDKIKAFFISTKDGVPYFTTKISGENADEQMLENAFNAGTFTEKFDIIIAMDNALPHMLTSEDLENAIKSIVNQLKVDGIFVASIRDYDSILMDKPSYSPPYIHKTDKGQRVSFQTWEWKDDIYKLIQYIVEDEDELQVSKFECEYRATTREEMTKLLLDYGCSKVEWKFPEETGFYQPIVVARKG